MKNTILHDLHASTAGWCSHDFPHTCSMDWIMFVIFLWFHHGVVAVWLSGLKRGWAAGSGDGGASWTTGQSLQEESACGLRPREGESTTRTTCLAGREFRSWTCDVCDGAFPQGSRNSARRWRVAGCHNSIELAGVLVFLSAAAWALCHQKDVAPINFGVILFDGDPRLWTSTCSPEILVACLAFQMVQITISASRPLSGLARGLLGCSTGLSYGHTLWVHALRLVAWFDPSLWGLAGGSHAWNRPQCATSLRRFTFSGASCGSWMCETFTGALQYKWATTADFWLGAKNQDLSGSCVAWISTGRSGTNSGGYFWPWFTALGFCTWWHGSFVGCHPICSQLRVPSNGEFGVPQGRHSGALASWTPWGDTWSTRRDRLFASSLGFVVQPALQWPFFGLCLYLLGGT